MNYKILVNKKNKLPADYVPNDLVVVETKSSNHLDSNHIVMLNKHVYKQFLIMKNEAKKLNYEIIIDSGYRTFEYQQKILENCIKEKGNKAYSLVALPGTSEHQTGIALDVALIRDNIYIDDINGTEKEIIWLHNNCYKYGFILRYPKYKEEITGYNYEPWHIRYVGKKIANFIYKNDITLEEYLNKK